MEKFFTNYHQILIEGFKNRDLLMAYYKGETIENYDVILSNPNSSSGSSQQIMQMSLAAFLAVFLVALA
jgi:hypothetical protein